MTASVRLRGSSLLLLSLLLLLAKFALVRRVVLGDGNPFHTLTLEGPLLLAGLLALDLTPIRFRRWVFLVSNLLISIGLFAIDLFASYFDQIPSLGMLSVLGQSATVKGSIFSLLSPHHLLLFLDLPVLALSVLRVGSESLGSPGTETPRPTLIHLFILLGLFLGAMGFHETRKLPLPQDSRGISLHRGLLIFELSNLTEPPVAGKETDPAGSPHLQDRIRELQDAKDGDRVADFSRGAAKGKNLIMIQVEALQAAVIDARIGGKEVTPFLNRLKKESWYFPNTVSAAGLGSTADAEFVANTSLFPPLRAAASVKYSNRTLPSLSRLLGQQRYQTLTYHTNWSGFWRRSNLYPALGFSRFYDQSFFGEEDRIAFGPSDEVLFRKTLDDLLPRFQKGERFYAFIITMSSHHPFDQIPPDRLHLPLPPPFSGTYTGRYLAAIEYADRALGRFIENLRRIGLLDASVLVVYGDHSALHDRNQPKSELAAHRALLGRDLSPTDRLRVPLFIRMPGQNHERIQSHAAGQIDIFPTIADPLGLDMSKVIHFGRDLFEGSGSMVSSAGFLAPGSYLDDDILYAAGDPFDQGAAYQLSTGERCPIRLASPVHRDASLELLRLSEAYVQRLPIRKVGP